jgi:hypothetical protein
MDWILGILITLAPFALFFAGVLLIAKLAKKAGKENFKQCFNCKMPIPKGALVCAHCGRDFG